MKNEWVTCRVITFGWSRVCNGRYTWLFFASQACHPCNGRYKVLTTSILRACNGRDMAASMRFSSLVDRGMAWLCHFNVLIGKIN